MKLKRWIIGYGCSVTTSILALVPCTATRIAVAADGDTEPQPEIKLLEGLAVGPVGRYGRSAFHTDDVERRIVLGKWETPQIGDVVTSADGGTRKWERIAAGDDGWFTGPALRGGYVHVSVPSETRKIMLLDAAGHSAVYVNGEIRAGDPYANGLMRIPILLRPGANQLLFFCRHGKLRASLQPPPAPYFIDTRDAVLPDLVAGQPVKALGSVLVVNATNSPFGGTVIEQDMVRGAAVETRHPALEKVGVYVGPMAPLSVRRAHFRLLGNSAPRTEAITVQLTLRPQGNDSDFSPFAESVTLRIRQPDQDRRQTFVSRIDGGVQYFAIRPATPKPQGDAGKPALVLTLHGAGVEALGQVQAYAGKSWAHIVAPTNRRPYGFDWEDWGQTDALEVLAEAAKLLSFDPRKVYLTGHSMGGHGAWNLGATFPDQFAAIGPSAGWISFSSYSGAENDQADSPVGQMLLRAASPSDTLALSRNYLHHGVYILHGESDDNVPVEQARLMRDHLKPFHKDFKYHEQPGAGHWWDDSDKPGTACVDWPEMFEFFSKHQIPKTESISHVEFATVSPGVSSVSHWVMIEAQEHPLQISTVSIKADPDQQSLVGTTLNVARMVLDIRRIPVKGLRAIKLDGQDVANIAALAPNQPARLAKNSGTWQIMARQPPANHKGPHRYGPFKHVFNNRVLLVYGTAGDDAENAWALAKARYDAETFWYRGNAKIDVIADVDYEPIEDLHRNVVLYGNADTNRHWSTMLAPCPVQISRGQVRIGERKLQGSDLGALLVYPKTGSPVALVGVVGGTGLAGMRVTDRLSYFVSGVAYPDCTVFDPSVLVDGVKGVKAAGFFGIDWQVKSGDFAFH